MKIHIHWWRYDGWDIGRGGIYFCRWKSCDAMRYGPQPMTAARPSLTLAAATRRCTVHDQTYTAACPDCRVDENAEGESA